MKLLAIETSTDACSAALLIDGTVLERYELAPRRHTALILPMVESVLAEAGLGVTQLDAIAFGQGPGAFTGVRVAVSIAQGIAFAADLPVVPISTLAALALGGARQTGHSSIAAALDARMGEIYWGNYRYVESDGTVQLQGEERVGPPLSASAPPGDWFGVGSGWQTYSALLSRCLTVSGWLGEWTPHAADIVRLAADAYQRGHGISADQALPVYLRNEVVNKPMVPGSAFGRL